MADRKLLEVELEEIEYRLYMENPEREDRIRLKDRQAEIEEALSTNKSIVVNGKSYPGGGNTPIFDNESVKGKETVKANEFLGEVFDEYHRATAVHGGFHSAHEAYGVILEEVDEFWDEVKKKRSKRDLNNMRKELIQIAAMALKAAVVLT